MEQQEAITIVLEARNDDIRALETDIVLLNEICRDLAEMVGNQGQSIQIASEQIETAVTNSEQTLANLTQSDGYAQSLMVRRQWLVKGAVACGGVTLGGIGIFFLSPVAGFVTAGAGIAGLIGMVTAMK